MQSFKIDYKQQLDYIQAEEGRAALIHDTSSDLFEKEFVCAERFPVRYIYSPRSFSLCEKRNSPQKV